MEVERRVKRSTGGVELVKALATEGHRIFSIEQAREAGQQVGIGAAYLTEALYHLRRTGWIVGLRRGLYALSPAWPGMAPLHEFEIAMALVDPAAVSHWSALQYHGLTDQAPREVFVLTTTDGSVPRKRGAKVAGGPYTVADTRFRFVQVRPERFFGTQQVWVGESRVMVTDPERTLVDGLAMPQHCGDFSEVLHAFSRRGGDLDAARAVDYGLRLDAAVAKRLGWVLERQGAEARQLDRLLTLPINGYRKLDPTGPRQGPCDSRWMIQVNTPGRVTA